MTRKDPEGLFLTAGDVARRLQVTERSVRRWIASGELVAHRFGACVRISPEDFQKFVEPKRRYDETNNNSENSGA